jgi:hypothetical protein
MCYPDRERRAICSDHSAAAWGTPSVFRGDDCAFGSPLAPYHLDPRIQATALQVNELLVQDTLMSAFSSSRQGNLWLSFKKSFRLYWARQEARPL